ncbi:peptide chain release factor 2 [bacterium]|mgnify:CR=1 FL=1|jgi:peptide chain release factor 2|nr:peptide chain release factor 2 [bacterium]MBT6832119.1 peptide chain release factor 2 [bacterium]MBT6996693.1 peptide chain release factor 2 [bacterium]MBT7772333.1 peptide chain release factor 2 [bacterium]
MEKNELLEKISDLNKKFEKVESALDLAKKNAEIESLREKMSAPGFWNDQESAKQISRDAAAGEDFVKKWEEIASTLKSLPELVELSDETEISEIEQEFYSIEKIFTAAETELFLSGEHDRKNVILKISTGNGGQDAEDFSKILLRMYLRFAETKNWKTQILEESFSDSGLKSATLEITGTNAYGFLKSEHGVHRLIRLSPFNAKNLRQTSFSRVEILPVIEQDTDLEIEEKDLRVDVFRSSGCGGQSVNTTDSAVRLTYLPLNLVVTCQNEKSQLQNKMSAMKVLKSRLLQLQLEQNAEKIEELRGEQMENSFGSQIRTYTLQPYKLVKDHRTDFENTNPDKVFDGELDGFIEAFLRKN